MAPPLNLWVKINAWTPPWKGAAASCNYLSSILAVRISLYTWSDFLALLSFTSVAYIPTWLATSSTLHRWPWSFQALGFLLVDQTVAIPLCFTPWSGRGLGGLKKRLGKLRCFRSYSHHVASVFPLKHLFRQCGQRVCMHWGLPSRVTGSNWPCHIKCQTCLVTSGWASASTPCSSFLGWEAGTKVLSKDRNGSTTSWAQVQGTLTCPTHQTSWSLKHHGHLCSELQQLRIAMIVVF